MPIKQCSIDGKPGYKWGDHGHCYTYDPNSPTSKAHARVRAGQQAAAAYAHGYKGGGEGEGKK